MGQGKSWSVTIVLEELKERISDEFMRQEVKLRDDRNPVLAANQLQTFVGMPKCCDMWNSDPETLDLLRMIDNVDSVELLEKGPFGAAIRVVRS